MGLDMYLSAKRYLSEYNPSDADLRAGVMALDFGMGDMEVKEVSFEAMYWRKANAIHRWFVQNVQDGVDDCRTSYVGREHLESLLRTCQEVKAKPKKADELLPTSSGFFFGGTEYDEWYFEGINDTIEIINEALAMPEEWEFEYHSSW